MSVDIKELANISAQAARTTKEQAAQADPDDCQLNIYMHVIRGDQPAMLLCGFDKEKSLTALRIAATGCSADAITFSAETWQSEVMQNPDTGEDWKVGEMEQYVTRHGLGHAVKEALLTYCVNREGDITYAVQPFVQRDREIEWQVPDAEFGSTPPLGYIPQRLKTIMAEPSMLDLLPEEALVLRRTLGEEASFFHQDMAVLRTLEERELIPAALLVAKPNTRRHELITERFGPPDSTGSGRSL